MPIAQPWQLSLQFQRTQMQEGVLGYMALASQLQQHPKPGNWVAAALVTVGPATQFLQLLQCPCLQPLTHSNSAVNPTTLAIAEASNSPPYPSYYPTTAAACNAGDPRHGGSAHHPRVPSSDTSSSKAPAIPEAHTTTMRAPGNTSDRGSRGWKVPILKYGQRQLR